MSWKGLALIAKFEFQFTDGLVTQTLLKHKHKLGEKLL